MKPQMPFRPYSEPRLDDMDEAPRVSGWVVLSWALAAFAGVAGSVGAAFLIVSLWGPQ